MFTMNIDMECHRRWTDNRLWTSTDKRTRCMQLSPGLNTSYCRKRRMCEEGTSCPLGTRCLDESTSCIMKDGAAYDYFVTTISTRPSRRSMLMLTSFA